MGGRYFANYFTFGINGFADYDFQDKIARLGAGAEFWLNYFKLGVNSYFGLNKWQDSQIENWDAKAASGFDVRGEFYLPARPEFGISAAYEKYFGMIDLGNSKDIKTLVRDPQSFTFGINYTPVPLITWSLEEKLSHSPSLESLRSETRLSWRATYRIGVPFVMQVDPTQVATVRSLAGNRYDLVSRNDNIILEYKEKKAPEVSIKINKNISGVEGTTQKIFEKAENVPADAQVIWSNEAGLSAACKKGRDLDLKECFITLPAYDDADPSKNKRSLTVTIKDGAGKDLFKDGTTITITKKGTKLVGLSLLSVDAENLEVSLNSDKNISSINDEAGFTIFLKLLDKSSGEPVSGLSDILGFAYGVGAAEALTDLSESEKEAGLYFQRFRARSVGAHKFMAFVRADSGDEYIFEKEAITLNFNDYVLPSSSKMDVSQNTIWQPGLTPNDHPVSTKILFTAFDENHSPISYGEEIKFEVLDDLGAQVLILKAMQVDGTYEAELLAKNLPTLSAGLDPYHFTVIPLVDGLDFSKDISVSVFVYPASNIVTEFDARLTAENYKLRYNERTLMTLYIKDRQTGEPKDIPVNDLTISLASSLKGQAASKEAEVTGLRKASEEGPGVYHAFFTAGTVTGVYAVEVYYKETEFLVSQRISVCEGGLSYEKSSLSADRDGVSITDKAGIDLVFTAKDGCDTPLSNLSNKLYYVIKDEQQNDNNYRIISALKEVYPGVYSQRIAGNIKGNYEVTLYFSNEKLFSINVHFTEAQVPEKFALMLEPDEIWQDILVNDSGKVLKSTKPTKTRLILESKHSDGSFAYVGSHVDVSIFDENANFVKNTTLSFLGGAYQGEFSSTEIEELAYRTSAYNYVFKPILESSIIPETAFATLKVHTLYPKPDDLDATLTVEKDKLYLGESTKVMLSLKNKVTDLPQDVPLKTLSLTLKSLGDGPGSATLTGLINVREGLYEAVFSGGDTPNNYIIKLYYREQEKAFKLLSVCDNSISMTASDFVSDRTEASITDSDGITLKLFVRNGCGIGLENLKDKIRFEIRDLFGSDDGYAIISDIKELEPGVYSQRIRGKYVGTYQIKAYIKGSNNIEEAFAKTLKIDFTAAIAPYKASIELAPRTIWQQAEEHPYYPTKTHIRLKSTHEDGSFASLGKEIFFLISDGKEDEIRVRAELKGDIYETDLDSLSLSNLEERNMPYVYTVRPYLAGVDFFEDVKGILYVYAGKKKVSELEATLVADKTQLPYGGETKVTLTVRRASDHSLVALPVSSLQFGIGSALHKRGPEAIDGFRQVSKGVYEALFKAGFESRDYTLYALYYQEELAKTAISICDFSFDVNKSSLKALSSQKPISDADGIEIRLAAVDSCGNMMSGLSDGIRFELVSATAGVDAVRFLSEVKEASPGIYVQHIGAKQAGSFKVRAYIKNEGTETLLNFPDVTLTFKDAVVPGGSKFDLSESAIWLETMEANGKPHEAVITLLSKHEDGRFAYLGETVEFKVSNQEDSHIITLKAKRIDQGYQAKFTADLVKDYPLRDKAYKLQITPYVLGVNFPNSIKKNLDVYAPLPKESRVFAKIESDKENVNLNDSAKIKFTLRDDKNAPLNIDTNYLKASTAEISKMHVTKAPVFSRVGPGAYELIFPVGAVLKMYVLSISYLERELGKVILNVCDFALSEEKSELSFDKLSAYNISPDGIVIKFMAKNGCNVPMTGLAKRIGFRYTNLDGTIAASIIFDLVQEIEPGVYTQRIRSRSSGSYIVTPFLRINGDEYHYEKKKQKVSFKKYVLSNASTIDVKSGYVAFADSGTNLPSEAVFKLALNDEDLKMLRPVLKEIEYKGYIDGKEVLKVSVSSDGYVRVPQSLLQAYKQYPGKGPVKISFKPEHEHIVFNSKLNTTVEVYGSLPSFNELSINWRSERYLYADKKDIKFTLGFKTKSGQPIILTDKHDFNKIFNITLGSVNFPPERVEHKGQGIYAFEYRFGDYTANYRFNLYYYHKNHQRYFVKTITIRTETTPEKLKLQFENPGEEKIIIGNTRLIEFKLLNDSVPETDLAGEDKLTADYVFLKEGRDGGFTEVTRPLLRGNEPTYYLYYKADRRVGKFKLRIWYKNKLMGEKVIVTHLPENFLAAGFIPEAFFDGNPSDVSTTTDKKFAFGQIDARMTAAIRVRHPDGWFVQDYYNPSISFKKIKNSGKVTVVTPFTGKGNGRYEAFICVDVPYIFHGYYIVEVFLEIGKMKNYSIGRLQPRRWYS